MGKKLIIRDHRHTSTRDQTNTYQTFVPSAAPRVLHTHTMGITYAFFVIAAPEPSSVKSVTDALKRNTAGIAM